MNIARQAPVTSEAVRALRWPGALLGLAAGGFFDGILLHQILQWHHLLSNVEAVDTLRLQLLADGLFHALMYVIAALALILLWRRRALLKLPRPGNSLRAHAVIGFGAWHVLDGVVSHWLLGIHRIKLDTTSPWLWDLAWFAAFGVLPILLGLLALRKPRSDGNSSDGRKAAISLAVVVLVAGPVAAIPMDSGDRTLVLFAPGVTPAAAFQALGEVDATILWTDSSGGLWLVRLDEKVSRWQLHRRGALLVSGSALPGGCLSWTRL